ncbi:hypothetical protein L1987_79621 [Smallanthus sonchifolius]|uniref:Uncharacterized protein n=1 Tax=Smallanthus sonchifolius TaxID=185202 RepID=A0ACB8YKB4_9ASTR|nr:hypothetical protein L1987_79621 [Smallanthus sonchifolius]
MLIWRCSNYPFLEPHTYFSKHTHTHYYFFPFSLIYCQRLSSLFSPTKIHLLPSQKKSCYSHGEREDKNKEN